VADYHGWGRSMPASLNALYARLDAVSKPKAKMDKRMIYAELNIPVLSALVVKLLGINVENLKLHAAFLEENIELVQRHLRMASFCRLPAKAPIGARREIDYVATQGLTPQCGTSMCIVGWVPNNPALDDQMDLIRQSPFYSWQDVSRLFVNTDRKDTSIFDYLFGPNWDDSVYLALDRIYNVIDAVENPSFEDPLRFLCAAANASDTELLVDTSDADLSYTKYYTTEEWVQSVREDLYVTDLVPDVDH